MQFLLRTNNTASNANATITPATASNNNSNTITRSRRARSSLPPPSSSPSGMEELKDLDSTPSHGRADSLASVSNETVRPTWNRNDEQTPPPIEINSPNAKQTPRSPQEQEAWLAKWRDPEPVRPAQAQRQRREATSNSAATNTTTETDVFSYRGPPKSPRRPITMTNGKIPKMPRTGILCQGTVDGEGLEEHLARCEFLKCSYVNVGYDFEAFKANVLKALEGDCPFESSSGDGKLVCKSIALTGDEDACPHRKCFFFALGCVFMGSKEEVFEHVLNKCPVFLLGGTIADLQDQVTSRDSHIHKLTRTISNLERQLSRLSIQQQHESERSDASSIDSPTELPKVQLQTAASHESLGLGVPPHLPTSISKESLCDLTAGYGSVSYKHSSALNPNSNLLLSPTRQRSFLKKTLTFLSRKKSTDILSSSSDNSSSLNIATMGNGEGPLRSPSKRSSTMRHDHLLPTTKKRRVTPPTLMFSASHSNLKDRATTISASSASASTRIPPTGTTRRRKGLEDIFPGTVIPSSSRSQSPPPPRTRSPMPRAQSPLPRAQSPVPRRAQSPRPHDPTLIPDMEPIEEQGQELSISSQPVFLVSPNATISRSTFLPPLSPIASDSGSSFRSVSSSTAVSFGTEHGNRHGTPATSHHSSSQHSSPYLDDEDASVTARGSSSSFETAVSSQTILAVGVKSKAMRRFPSLNGEEEQEVVGLHL